LRTAGKYTQYFGVTGVAEGIGVSVGVSVMVGVSVGVSVAPEADNAT